MTALFMIGELKDCCPTLSDNNYHIRGFHPEGNLSFEADEAKCKVCECGHDTKRCPYIHPLNRHQEDSPKFIGPFCIWCHHKHLGINCPNKDRVQMLCRIIKREEEFLVSTQSESLIDDSTELIKKLKKQLQTITNG